MRRASVSESTATRPLLRVLLISRPPRPSLLLLLPADVVVRHLLSFFQLLHLMEMRRLCRSLRPLYETAAVDSMRATALRGLQSATQWESASSSSFSAHITSCSCQTRPG